VLAEVDQCSLSPSEMREVDDDVVAFGDALLVERGSVTGCGSRLPSLPICESLRAPEALASASLKKRDDAGVEDAEAVLPALDLEVGRYARFTVITSPRNRRS
jgi:hypothetical protein